MTKNGVGLVEPWCHETSPALPELTRRLDEVVADGRQLSVALCNLPLTETGARYVAVTTDIAHNRRYMT